MVQIMNRVEQQRLESISKIESEIQQATEWRVGLEQAEVTIRQSVAAEGLTPAAKHRIKSSADEILAEIVEVDRKIAERVEAVAVIRKHMAAAAEGKGPLHSRDPDISTRGYSTETTGPGSAPIDPEFAKIALVAHS